MLALHAVESFLHISIAHFSFFSSKENKEWAFTGLTSDGPA